MPALARLKAVSCQLSVVSVPITVHVSFNDLLLRFDQSAGRDDRRPISFLWIPFLVPYRLHGVMPPSFDVPLLSMEIPDRFPVSTSVGD